MYLTITKNRITLQEKNYMSKTVLVTGASGFIGAPLVRRLVKSGCKVKALDNNVRGSRTKLVEVEKDIEFIESDIRDRQVVLDAAKDVDEVFHLAYINGTKYFYSHPELILDIGVKGIINVLDACIQNNVRKLYLASSSEVYQTPIEVPTTEDVKLVVPDPMNPRYSYGGGKIISELMAINYGRKYFDKVVIFRPHNVYGEWMGWEHVIPELCVKINKLKQDEDVIDFQIQGSGNETRAFIYINDFIDGVMLLRERGEHLKTYNIGTQEEVTVKRLVELIAEYNNKKIHIIPCELRAGGTIRRCPDISKISSLGFKPKVSLSKGLKSVVDWYNKNLSLKDHTKTEEKICNTQLL